jgi:L-threonylcarbamoyladenylate synthase
MDTEILPCDHPIALSRAFELIQAGAPVAFPTDTVYGLGALAFDKRAIEGLYTAKGREASKAIAVLVGNVADLSIVAGIMGKTAQRLAEQFWPGPLTLVVPGSTALPSNLSPSTTIGVRMPDHPAALRLLNLCGPLAVTSANRSGSPSACTAQEVFEQLGGQIPLILDGGRTPGGLPSTVVDCSGPELVILRQGPLTLEALRFILS